MVCAQMIPLGDGNNIKEGGMLFSLSSLLLFRFELIKVVQV